MTFTPTDEQLAAVEEAKSRSNNFQLRALAGAAKTSTLVLMAEALPSTSILCLAFNKKIAVEMAERLPTNCESMTLNSLGHRAWGQFLGQRLRLEKSKNYQLIKAEVEKLSGAEAEEASENFANYVRWLGVAKTLGWIPDKTHSAATHICSNDEFFSSLDEDPGALGERILLRAHKAGLDLALDGVIDFDDQVMMPALWPVSFPNYPLVMVDEAQDLSPLNHMTLRKLARKRLIAVGDPCQAIYGFRGADGDSMDNLQQMFDMNILPLTISFRCPKAVVREAHWRAPEMRSPEWAVEGEVKHLGPWSMDDIPSDAVVLCRNNAPIFAMAIQFFAHGRAVEIVGNDVGKLVIKALQSLSKRKDNPTQAEVFDRIEMWEANKLQKSRDKRKVRDLAACLRVFARNGETLSQIIAQAEHIMRSTGNIKMMTGHKSKGLEFPNVFILDRDLCRINKEDSQDRNILYVMQTRAQVNLTYIESEQFQSDLVEEGEAA